MIGTVAGTRVFEADGWRPGAALSLGWIGAMLLVLLLRGPRCPKGVWFGWQGGWSLRADTEKTTGTEQHHNDLAINGQDDPEKVIHAAGRDETGSSIEQPEKVTATET